MPSDAVPGQVIDAQLWLTVYGLGTGALTGTPGTPGTPDVAAWDPRDPGFRHDPFPWYRALREQSPVHVHPEVGVVLSRYADVEALLPWLDFAYGKAKEKLPKAA